MAEKTQHSNHKQQPDHRPNREVQQALYTENNPMMDSLPDVTTHNPPLTPGNILKLQRTIGNKATQRNFVAPQSYKSQQFVSPLVQRDMQANALVNRSPAKKSSPLIQREGGDDKGGVPAGNVYEKKVEYKGDRWSFSLAFSFSKADTSPLKGKTGPLSGQIGESKLSSTKSYSSGATKSANAMSLAMAKSSLDIAELMPGVKVKADLKALEAKLENGDVDVDVFKVAVAVEGSLTKAIQGTEVGDAILATELGEVIMNDTAIKVTGKIEIKIDPSDVARLVRMAKLNKEMIKNAEAAAKAQKKLDALESENKKIRDKLKKRKGMNPKKRANLKSRLASNNKKMGNLQKVLKDNKTATKLVKESFEEAAKGLKSKAGRIVGGIVKKVGGKLLMKAIPVIGWLLTAVDVGTIIYGLFSGTLEFGFGGGDGGDGGTGGEATDGGTGDTGVSGGVPGGTVEDGTTDDTGDTVDGGTGHSGGGTGSAGGDTGEMDDLGPEIDITEDESYEPSTGLAGDTGSGDAGAEPEINPAAAAVLEAIKSKQGVKFTPDDMAQLNGIVPANLEGEHLAALLEWLKNKEGQQATDIFEVLGAIQNKISQLQNPPEQATVVDDTGQVEQIPMEDAGTGAEEKKEEKDAPDVEAIKKSIASAKSAMAAKGMEVYSQLPEDLAAQGVSKGSVISSWVFLMDGNGNAYGGSGVMIVVEKKSGSNQVKVQLQPMILYNEQGQPATRTKAATLDLMLME